ncbi:MAG: acyclic terpene utilization AtuA family protein [Burkholderiales bacterium]
MNTRAKIRIGAGAGYSGDRIPPAVELAEKGNLDYLVFECLAERTIALAQLEKSKNPQLGFDPLLRDRMEAVLPVCVRNGVKIITNMGATNPRAAAMEVLAVARELGLTRLKIALIEGDDVLSQLRLAENQRQLILTESEQPLPALMNNVISANAYLGAEPLVKALASGADVIITGRVADPALFLAPLVYEFAWSVDDWTRLGRGILVGHLLECAGQVTGGYFADPGFRDVPDLAHLGFPIAEVSADGNAVITKVEGSGGCVTRATCTAQLLYEIGDPSRYVQADVIADFSKVIFEQIAPDRVRVQGGDGLARTNTLKVSIGYRDGFIGEGQISYAGLGAVARGRLALDLLKIRLADAGLGSCESRFELIGLNSSHGQRLGRNEAKNHEPYEVRARAALRVASRKQAERVANEVEALYLNGPSGGGGVTQSVREVIAVASTLIPREWVTTSVTVMEL